MKSRKNGMGAILTDNRTGLLVIVVVIVVIVGAINPMFFSPHFVMNPILTNVAIFTVVGLAQMVVLSVGQMNLAVGGMAAVGTLASALTFQAFHLPLIIGLLVGLVVGGLAGGLAGVVIARGGVNAFVVTLALNFALLGLVPAVYKAASPGAAITVHVPGLSELGQWQLSDVCIGDTCGPDGIPVLIFVAIAAMIIIGVLYSRSRIGREILFTGSGERAALLSAIPVSRRIIIVHTLSGALAALAGFMLAAHNGSFTPGIGDEFMLQSFLGPILGGTLLVGGYVSVIGTLLGTALTSVIRQALLLFGVGLDTLNIWLGIVLLVALSADRVREVTGRRSKLRAIRRSDNTIDTTSDEVTSS